MNDFRRHDDDPLYERLQRLENHVSTLETKVNTLSLEQKHTHELFSSKFTAMERSQDLALSELRGLRESIITMSSEPDKSPAGRAIMRDLAEFEVGARKRTEGLAELREWQNQIETVIGLLKWMQLSGIVALIWVALRAFGKAP